MGKDESWAGIVRKKSRNMPDGSNMYHYVEIEFTDGKVKKVRIDGSLWDALTPGDEIIKWAGADPLKK